jgi:hypothetical protein
MTKQFDDAYPQPFGPSTLTALYGYGERIEYPVTNAYWRAGKDYKSGKEIQVLVLESSIWPEWPLRPHQAKAAAAALGRDETQWPGATLVGYLEETPVGDTVKVDQRRCKKATASKAPPSNGRQIHPGEQVYDDGSIEALPNESEFE